MRIYTATATTNQAPRGETPGVEVKALEYVGRTGWAVQGVEVRSGPVDWPRWNPVQVDAELAALGWLRIRDWESGGGQHFAEVVRAG